MFLQKKQNYYIFCQIDAISKEIEFQQLEIELSEKRIKEHKAQIENKKEVLAESQSRIDEKQDLLDQKKKELDEIIAETKKEEEILLEQSEKEAKNICFSIANSPLVKTALAGEDPNWGRRLNRMRDRRLSHGNALQMHRS